MMSTGQAGLSEIAVEIEGHVSAYNVPVWCHAQAQQQPYYQPAKVPAVVDHGSRAGPKDEVEANDERQIAQLAGGPLQRSVPQKVAR